MARRSILVTTTQRVEVEIHDPALVPAEVAAFSRSMFPISGPNDLFKFAADQATRHGRRAVFFVEGVGQALMQTSETDRADERHPVLFRIVETDTELEVLT